MYSTFIDGVLVTASTKEELAQKIADDRENRG